MIEVSATNTLYEYILLKFKDFTLKKNDFINIILK